MAISVSFSFSGLLNRGPGAQPLWVLVFSTASYLQLVWSPNWLNFLCTELYYSSMPTQFLPINGQRNIHFYRLWNDMFWSSSSGNNCHAVHRSLSSGASVCDCTLGILTLSHIVSQAPPRQWNMHFRRLWNGMFGRVGGQYTPLGESYTSTEVHSIYSTVPANWAHIIMDNNCKIDFGIK